MSRQSRSQRPQISTNGQSALKALMMGSMAGSTTANPDFDPSGIGSTAMPGDVPYDIYAGKDMSAYRGMTPIQVANTPLRPTSGLQESLGNPSNKINADYNISTAERGLELRNAKDMLGLQTEASRGLQKDRFDQEDKTNDTRFSQEKELNLIKNLSEKELLKSRQIAEIATKYGITVDMMTPENLAKFQAQMDSDVGKTISKNTLETTTADQSNAALINNPDLIARDKKALVQEREIANMRNSLYTQPIGTTSINLTKGIPSRISQPYPSREPIYTDIGGMRTPSGQFNEAMTPPEIRYSAEEADKIANGNSNPSFKNIGTTPANFGSETTSVMGIPLAPARAAHSVSTADSSPAGEFKRVAQQYNSRVYGRNKGADANRVALFPELAAEFKVQPRQIGSSVMTTAPERVVESEFGTYSNQFDQLPLEQQNAVYRRAIQRLQSQMSTVR